MLRIDAGERSWNSVNGRLRWEVGINGSPIYKLGTGSQGEVTNRIFTFKGLF